MEEKKSLFGRIKFISGNVAHVESISSAEEMGDLMNVHVVFEAPDQAILGEVEEVTDEVIKIRFLGEFRDGRYVSGVIRKPVLSSIIRTINDGELDMIVGVYDETTFKLGQSSIYTDKTVCADINNLFANHMAVFGNTGSGKSCGVARLVQNIFSNPKLVSYNANIFIFDAYGEYKTAFNQLDKINPNYTYKFITTNVQEETDYEMKIPFHLLSLDDITIMLQADKHSQIPILERSLKLTKIFSKDDEVAEKYKNHLIAKALIAIIYSNQITANKKNEIFKVLEVCNTNDFNFGSVIQGLGYTRTLSECFEIDSNGNFGESVLITDYILSHIDDELEMTAEPTNAFYSMRDFAGAMEFTLISEGFQNNDQLYDDAMLLQVRLNSIINSKLAKIYKSDNYVSLETYIASLVAVGNRKAQVINMNLEDVDDTHAKIIVKIVARIFFDFCKTRKKRAQIPFHLFLEEAHRYVIKDNDVFLLGYNIFDRIAKEGRKYGVLLNIISQRPVEISETVIAQCSNFLIFKMTHPKDIEYIRTMLPNISADVIEKQKILQPGNCVGFGGAFKLPMVVKMEMPDPPPNSNSCDVNNCWRIQGDVVAANSGNNAAVTEKDNPTAKDMPAPAPIAPTIPVENIQEQAIVTNENIQPEPTDNINNVIPDALPNNTFENPVVTTETQQENIAPNIEQPQQENFVAPIEEQPIPQPVEQPIIELQPTQPTFEASQPENPIVNQNVYQPETSNEFSTPNQASMPGDNNVLIRPSIPVDISNQGNGQF